MKDKNSISPDVFFDQLDSDSLSPICNMQKEASKSISSFSYNGLSGTSSIQDLFRMDPYPPGTFSPNFDIGDSNPKESLIKVVKVFSHFRRPDYTLVKKEGAQNDGESGRPRYARFREKQFVCDVCDRSFTMKQNMAHHFYQYHHPRLAAYNRPQQEFILKYECTKCNMTFSDKDKADRHEKVHKPPPEKNSFTCDKCDKVFHTVQGLTEHVQVVHDRLRPYRCDKCGQEFGRSGGLRRHVLMVHENKLFKCTYANCDHPGYKCSKALAAHIRSVHTHERPFPCEICGRRFIRKNDLKVHTSTHSNESNYKCPDCGAAFKRDTYLRKHRQGCEGNRTSRRLKKKTKKSKRKYMRREMYRLLKAGGVAGLAVGSFLLGTQCQDSSIFLRRATAAVATVAPQLPPIPLSPTEKVEVGVSRASQIMQYGYPGFDNLRTFEDFVLSYDNKTKTAHWVCEHLTPGRLVYDPSVDRSKCQFRADESMHAYFRSLNEDYRSSGYDRGHLAAAGNHRKTQNSVDQTFLLTNMSPQVGKGFNRDKWNDLEKYTRTVAKKSLNTYILTGPLYMPRKEADGNLYVKYKVIGKNNVAVPTHFFKVLLYETSVGSFDLESFVLPNEVIPDSVDIKSFYVPLEMIERSGGFLIFNKIPKGAIKQVNGKRAVTGGFW